MANGVTRIQYLLLMLFKSRTSYSVFIITPYSIATMRSRWEGSGFCSSNWFSSGTWLLLQASGSAFTGFVVGSLGLDALSGAISF